MVEALREDTVSLFQGFLPDVVILGPNSISDATRLVHAIFKTSGKRNGATSQFVFNCVTDLYRQRHSSCTQLE